MSQPIVEESHIFLMCPQATNLGLLCKHLIGCRGGGAKAHITCKFDI